MKTLRAAALLTALLPLAAFAQCPVIGVTPSSLPGGAQGIAYGPVPFSAAPGGPYSFTASGYPAGMTFVAGALGGTPTASGTFAVRVVATDASGCLATHTLPLQICASITVTNPGNASGTAGQAFSETFTQAGGTGTITWSVTGTLPSGITLDSSTGVLSGTTAQTGSFPITVTATDSNGCTGTGALYTLVIAPVAVNDTYAPTVTGNMSIDTATGTNFTVLTNDTPGATANLVGGGTTAQGGQVSLGSATGTFTYNPPRGYEGADSFQYTVTKDAVTSAPATVSITVGGMVWFVNDNPAACSASCDGRRTNPYTTLAAFQAVNTGTAPDAKANDRVFLYESNPPAAYTGPVTLLNGQRLIGQDATVIFAAATGYTIPDTTVAVPVMDAANAFVTNLAVGAPTTNGINLAQDNTVTGMTVSGANDTAIARAAGNLGTATITDVAVVTSGTGSALVLTDTTGALTFSTGSVTHAGSGLALSVNGGTSAVTIGVPITASAGQVASILNRGAGAVVNVTGAVNATGAVTGIAVATPTGADSVSFGSVTLGTALSRLSGGTALFVNHNGQAATTSFTNLSIFTSGQTAIDASSGGALNVTSGSVDALNGRALLLSTIGLGVTLSGITQTAGPGQGISMSSVTGSLTSALTSITTPPTQGILVTGSTANLAFGNTTVDGGTDGLSLQNNSAGTRSFGTLSIGGGTAPSGTGFLHAVGGGNVSVSGAATVASAGSAVVDIQGAAAGSSVTFSGGLTASRTNAGTAVVLGTPTANSLTSTLSFGAFNVTAPNGVALSLGTTPIGATSGTVSATNGAAISASGTSFGATFTSVSSTGATNGISLTNCTGNLTMNGGSLTGSGAPFFVTNGTLNATYAGNVSQASAGQPVVSITGHATGAITFQTGTVSATNGTGILLSNADGAVNFNGTTTLNGGDAGVDVTGGSSGAITFAAAAQIGNVSSPTGVAFDINNGNATTNVTYNGTIATTANRPVSVQNVGTGSTISFTGNITSTSNGIQLLTMGNPTMVTFSGASKSLSVGANTAVTMAGAAGNNVTFSGGGLAITRTTGAGINATGGGTLTISGAGNTIGSGTSGTALNVSSVSIGAGGLTFQSIAQNGGANGIVLSNTGAAGGLTITGNGGTCTLATPTCTGGTIQSTAGADDSGATPAGTGIVLNNTASVSLTRVRINGNANYGIRGTSVAGFTMASCVIDGVNGTNAASPFNEGSARFTNLTGSASVTSTGITGGYADNFRVVNTTGTLNRITFDSVTIGGNDATNGNDGITLESQGATTFNATVQNSTFTSAAGDLFQLNLIGATTSDLVFTGNTLSNNHPNIATGGGGVTISGGDGSGANLTFNIASSSFRDADGHAVLIVKSTDPGTFNGTFNLNTIGVAATPNSGSGAGSGLKVQSAGGGTVQVAVTNNQIRQYNNFGIELTTGGSATPQGGNFYATVTGNTVANPGTGGLPMNGIHLNGGTVVGDTYSICTNIGGAGPLANIITGSGANGGTDFRLRQRQNTTVRLPGYAGANNDNAAVVTFVQGRNGGASGLASNTVGSGGGGFTGGGTTCP